VLITHNNEHGISSINIVDAQTLITVCGSISRCLFLIVRGFVGSFIAPILGFIRDHRDPRIPLVPAAQPRVWGKFCLFV